MVSSAAGAIAVAAGDLVLAFACYKARTVLGGIVSVGSAVLVGLSAGQGWRGSVATAEGLAALAFLIVGVVLLVRRAAGGGAADALAAFGRSLGLRVGGTVRSSVGRRYLKSVVPGLVGTVRFDWEALDAWYEEDELVFVHPRNRYVRVDALRSSRHVRVERDGIVLAESPSPVLVFETGLPTRYYFDRTAVNFDQLVPSATVTACPYKGKTTGYWSVRTGEDTIADLAWTYDFPTRQLLPVAGLVAFYDEQVDTFINGIERPRPETHFFKP